MWENGVLDAAVPVTISINFFVKTAFDHISVTDDEDIHKSTCSVLVLIIKAGGRVLEVQERQEKGRAMEG